MGKNGERERKKERKKEKKEKYVYLKSSSKRIPNAIKMGSWFSWFFLLIFSVFFRFLVRFLG